jgi:hypothetical protein
MLHQLGFCFFGWLISFSKRLRIFYFIFGSPVAKFRKSRQISLLGSQKYGGCLNSFLLLYLVCIPCLAKLPFGQFSSITKNGEGGRGRVDYLLIKTPPPTEA